MEVAVNDYGQVLSSWSTSGGFFNPPFESPTTLWTPTVEHGTLGTTIVITASGSTLTLNNFGQVGMYVGPVGPFTNGSPAIWTPTAANATTGVVTTNAQWNELVAMNSYGQAIMGLGEPPLLFTPSTPNGAVGTFTSIPGLVGASHVVAINDSGEVLGVSCITESSTTCQNQGFIWTPSNAYGTSGTTVAMAMPPGFIGTLPAAINLSGSVVGTMSSGGGIAIWYCAWTLCLWWTG